MADALSAELEAALRTIVRSELDAITARQARADRASRRAGLIETLGRYAEDIARHDETIRGFRAEGRSAASFVRMRSEIYDRIVAIVDELRSGDAGDAAESAVR